MPNGKYFPPLNVTSAFLETPELCETRRVDETSVYFIFSFNIKESFSKFPPTFIRKMNNDNFINGRDMNDGQLVHLDIFKNILIEQTDNSQDISLSFIEKKRLEPLYFIPDSFNIQSEVHFLSVSYRKNNVHQLKS